MLRRPVLPLPSHIYPPDPWRLVERRCPIEPTGRAETIFALANGYLGVRGSLEEGRPAYAPGTFVNGFHEVRPIVHAEQAYGLARLGQTIVPLPDATVMTLSVDDEPLFLPHARLRAYERVLDMREGTLTRELRWSTPAGKHVRVRSCRLVSFEDRHVLAIQYDVELLDHPAPLALTSWLLDQAPEPPAGTASPEDPRLGARLPRSALVRVSRDLVDGRFLLGYRAACSGMTLGVAAAHVVESSTDIHVTHALRDQGAEVTVVADGTAGTVIRVMKYVAYHTSRSAPVEELLARCGRTLDRVTTHGFDALVATQRRHLDRYWARADVVVEMPDGSATEQQAVRWNLFQLAQAAWRAEGAGVPAKGLTGTGYDGHYFWDTEIYLLPFLALTHPRIARNLLRFRYSMLDKARSRARELSQRGALFPWRTINGDEASAYYEAGTAQYHIDADIAFAIWTYVTLRGDPGFLAEVGAEMLVETARLWQDLGFYGRDGRFHIHGVTGPDEYTTLVNDNTYTNLMARANLRYAVQALHVLEDDFPDSYRALVDDVRLAADEPDEWLRAADAMHVPYDEARGIHPQDSAFLEREVWDVAGTPPEDFPLLLHFHPLVIYRHQVIKQADIVLAMALLPMEFSKEQKRRNFDYYDPLTTGDSSLSACVQSIIAAEIGREDAALEYFRFALLMDLGAATDNAWNGVHVASAAGVWQALVLGFGGVRVCERGLSFDPALPRTWRRLAFSILYRGRAIRVELEQAHERLLLEAGPALAVEFRGDATVLHEGVPLVLSHPVP